MEFAKVARGNRKAKKKPVKDELDRMKLAEKKKRRLEKALAASAAICAELEKKKLKKKEEQEKLYEEGASIAEAVALQVLLGEDSDDSSHVMLQKDHVLIRSPSWDPLNGTNIFTKRRLPQYSCYNILSPHASENVEICSGPRQSGQMWSNYNAVASSDHSGRGFYQPYFEGDARWGNIGVSVDHVTTARAFSSLKICDNAAMTDACVYSRVLRGSN